SGGDGFLNRYSQSSVAEDMAEVYAYLITRPKAVKRRTKKDDVLDAKVTMLKRHLLIFSPHIDDGFWEAAAQPRPAAIAKTAAPPAPEDTEKGGERPQKPD
ncbi:MAG: hypothetical protein ACYTGZ_09295, partial [Planctomycetota bacterium]